jgi:AAA15 family ATPase/GTPase
LFVRNGDDFSISERFKKEAKDLKSVTRDNALFISVIAQFNGSLSGDIIKWFKKITFINYRHNPSFSEPLKPMLKDTKNLEAFSELFKLFDIGVSKLKVEENQVIDRPEFSKLPDSIKDIVRETSMLNNYSVKTTHDVYDADGNKVNTIDFDLDTHESDGTKKLYSILPSLMMATATGGVIVIDELDSRLHPLITETLIKVFHSVDVGNKNVAQLIFTTHDTNLLRKENFRRDQIWFVEKDQKGSSTLYSLSEIQSRNDANYESDYLKGRYGAVPFINTSIIQDHFGN